HQQHESDPRRALRGAPRPRKPRRRGRLGRNGDPPVSSAQNFRTAALADDPPWSRDEFERRLRAMGADYHIHHPFNVMLNSGRASREQIQGWVANRYYYQIAIPRKDAAILANCPDRAVRRQWVLRIL